MSCQTEQLKVLTHQRGKHFISAECGAAGVGCGLHTSAGCLPRPGSPACLLGAPLVAADHQGGYALQYSFQNVTVEGDDGASPHLTNDNHGAVVMKLVFDRMRICLPLQYLAFLGGIVCCLKFILILSTPPIGCRSCWPPPLLARRGQSFFF